MLPKSWLLFAFLVGPMLAQDHYIEDTFQNRIGEVPQLGWYDPDHGFLATASAPQVTIYGPVGMTRTARKKGVFSGDSFRALQQSGLACELNPQDSLTVYTVAPGVDTDRVLYTTKALPGTSHSGLISVPFDSKRLAAVNRVLGWPAAGALRRDEAFASRAGSFFYSHHRLYSSETKLLQQEAIILHGKAGQINAVHLKRNIDTEPFCADCANPEYADKELGLYRLLNVFELPGFPYPLLLLDSGTVEGRARSLMTFTPNRKIAQYRVYEYVVNCG